MYTRSLHKVDGLLKYKPIAKGPKCQILSNLVKSKLTCNLPAIHYLTRPPEFLAP